MSFHNRIASRGPQSEHRSSQQWTTLPSREAYVTLASVQENRGSKGSGNKRSRGQNPVPSGTALNWIDALGTGRGAGRGGGDDTSVQAEATLSATGRMQGAVSKGVLTLRMRYVCSHEMFVTLRVASHLSCMFYGVYTTILWYVRKNAAMMSVIGFSCVLRLRGY